MVSLERIHHAMFDFSGDKLLHSIFTIAVAQLPPPMTAIFLLMMCEFTEKGHETRDVGHENKFIGSLVVDRKFRDDLLKFLRRGNLKEAVNRFWNNNKNSRCRNVSNRWEVGFRNKHFAIHLFSSCQFVWWIQFRSNTIFFRRVQIV